MTNPKRKRSQLWNDRNRLNSSQRRARQRRAPRGALHQIDLNTTTPAPSSVSFPFVSPPTFGNQNKSPQQSALSSQSHRNMTLQECYSYLNVGTLPPCPLFQNDHIKKCQRSFLSMIYHAKRKTDPKPMFHCPFCKQRFINTHAFLGKRVDRTHGYQCMSCHDDISKEYKIRKFSQENNMDPMVKFDHFLLPELTDTEQMMISLYHPFVRMARLSGGGVGYRGHVITVEQDIENWSAANLPLLPNDLPYFIVRKPNKASPCGYKDFRINKANILTWLSFLKLNNEHYANIDLSSCKERLSQIPDDISGSLRSMTEEELEETLNASKDDEESANPNPFSTKRSFRSLQRRKMVNDDVMNAYMKLLQSREESISSVEGRKMSICLPTTFYSNIENFGVSDARRKYRRRFESIAEADKLVIPINIDNVHWVLVIVSIPEKRITIIDSMRGEDEEGFPSKIRDFLNLFDCFSRHSWTLEKAHVPDHSHQPNTNQWDCGLFVLFYSDFILQKKKIGFNEAWVSASRNYVASCILKNLILA
jgi:hypothetical protein